MKTFKVPKVLKLDLKTWRCGGDRPDGKIGLGIGDTSLLNDDDCMCCLGQFAKQCKVPNKLLIHNGSPADIMDENGDGVLVQKFSKKRMFGAVNTKLSDECIAINDNECTTIQEKINKLRRVLKKAGLKLQVKNFSILKR